MRATAVAHPSAAVSRSGGRAAALAPRRTRARTVIGSPPPAAAAFLLAGVLVAAVRGLVPFAHGWWLVSYLVLVGGISQWLLGGAQGWSAPDRRLPLWLWNLGTIAVAVADPLSAPAGVLAGSVVLLAALALFAHGGAPGPPWRRPYLLLVAFLAGSVVVGCLLADALPL
jgi:hypothetical protein